MAAAGQAQASQMAVVALAAQIPLYTGREDAKPWCQMIDKIKATAALTNDVTAALAVIRFSPDSTIDKWYKFEIEHGTLQNLHFWDTVEAVEAQPNARPPVVGVIAVPGGLREAIMKAFGIKWTRDVLNQRLKANKEQEAGEPFKFWFFRFRPIIQKEIEMDFEGTEMVTTKANKAILMERNCFNYLWQGMRQEHKTWMEPKREQLTTVKNLLDSAEAFELSLKGIQFLAMSKSSLPRPLAAAAVSYQNSTAETNTSKTNEVAPEGSCPYCGILGHGLPHLEPKRQKCHKKEFDISKGDIRDKHKDYPCKTQAQIKAERKASKEAKEVKEDEKSAQQQGQLGITPTPIVGAIFDDSAKQAVPASPFPNAPVTPGAIVPYTGHVSAISSAHLAPSGGQAFSYYGLPTNYVPAGNAPASQMPQYEPNP